ncbi:hypothetical protein ACFC1B_30635, partial [Streptomyces xiamenensis]
LDGALRADPGPVQFWAPADVCDPLPGEDYADVLTDRPRPRTPAFLIEETASACADTSGSEGLVVHRGTCAAPAGVVYPAAPATARRAAATGAARCEICAPPAP